MRRGERISDRVFVLVTLESFVVSLVSLFFFCNFLGVGEGDCALLFFSRYPWY